MSDVTDIQVDICSLLYFVEIVINFKKFLLFLSDVTIYHEKPDVAISKNVCFFSCITYFKNSQEAN